MEHTANDFDRVQHSTNDFDQIQYLTMNDSKEKPFVIDFHIYQKFICYNHFWGLTVINFHCLLESLLEVHFPKKNPFPHKLEGDSTSP